MDKDVRRTDDRGYDTTFQRGRLLEAADLVADMYSGRRVTVMGLGRFGGGIGVVRFLATQGARVTVTDRQSESQLADSLERIAGVPVDRWRLGEHCEEDFTSADLIVASPAIRPDHSCLEAARANGVPVTTEIGLFWQHCPARIIGVTGTVGKSTTASLIAHLLEADGRRVHLGGNLGGSLLNELSDIATDDWVVLELSSFQLTYLDADRRSPHVAVVTNFSPNHLDWHCSLDEYCFAKQTVLRHQSPRDVAVLPANDHFGSWATHGRRIQFGEDVGYSDGVSVTNEGWHIRLGDMEASVGNERLRSLPGAHNRLNVAAATAVAVGVGVSPSTCEPALESFQSLPHRLEFVGEVGGVRFYDDSKATTPKAAIAALQAFEAPLIVLVGGADKGVNLRPFAQELARQAKAVALMGDTGPSLAAEAGPIDDGDQLAVHMSDDFRDAFGWAVSQATRGDIILLSPGCASFGWFRDYADRGDQFRAAVDELRR